MRILLINPPSPFLINQAAFPPLALLYLEAAVDADVDVVDLCCSHPLPQRRYDLIGLSVSTCHVPQIPYLMKQLREMYGETPIIMGGPHATNLPKDCLQLGADAVCVGDGEEVISWALAGGRNTLHHRVDINSWPLPNRNAINLFDYYYEIGGERATSIITARGCPYSCAFCSRGVGYDTIRYYGLERVAHELDDIKRLGFNAVQIYDDEVNCSATRFTYLCDLLKKAGMKWRAFVRGDLFTEEQAREARESGCVELCCGLESGSDEILRKVNKKCTTKEVAEARKLCKAAGIRFKTFAMVGLPGETKETAEMTRRWLLENEPDDFDVAVYTPYPGSAIATFPWEYDIVIDKSPSEVTYTHKGTPGKYAAASHTSHLSAEQIVELRDDIEENVRKELGLKAL